MKFRKKPIVIEAEQWFPGKEIEGVITEGLGGGLMMAPNANGVFDQIGYIETFEGKMIVYPGDWIIQGINGEKYPCKPDIFEKTYERVCEESQVKGTVFVEVEYP